MIEISKGYKILVITNPRPLAGVIPTSNLISILTEISSSLFLFTGNEGKIVLDKYLLKGKSIEYKSFNNPLYRVINYLKFQLLAVKYMIDNIKNYDFCLFYMAEGLFLPVIMTKLLNKKSLLCLTSMMQKVSENSTGTSVSSRIINFVEKLSYAFSYKLLLYSPKLVSKWDLEKYKSKTIFIHEHHLDIINYGIRNDVIKRKNNIGYIGRYNKEKGIINFIISAISLKNTRKDLCFFVYGDGDLKSSIKNMIYESNSEINIKLNGWIAHNKLPDILNNLKLIVIPSYTEGLPNIMLEAMACGTPILATSVGAIPDIIKDGENGFLLRSNDPKHIAERVVEILDRPEILKKVSINAYWCVKENFSYEKTLMAWQKIFSEFGMHNHTRSY